MVSTTGYPTDVDAEEDAWGILGGRSIPKFDRFAVENPPESGQYVDFPVGTSYTGVVAENPRSYQANDYDTKQPKFYTSGQKIMEVSIVLDTDYREAEDDDGRRIMRLGSIGKSALQSEMKRLGIKQFGIGTKLTVTFVGYRANKSGRASKLVNIDLVPTEYIKSQAADVNAALAQGGWSEVAPGNATFPGQVIPAPVQAAPPVQQFVAPVQQVQAPVAAVAPVAAPAAAPAAVSAPAAAGGGMPSASEIATQLSTAQLLISNGIPRAAALEAAATVNGTVNPILQVMLDQALSAASGEMPAA